LERLCGKRKGSVERGKGLWKEERVCGKRKGSVEAADMREVWSVVCCFVRTIRQGRNMTAKPMEDLP